MNLQLSLKQKWFLMTKEGVKREDYREINPYWCSRLLLSFTGEKKSMKWWQYKFEVMDGTQEEIKENIELFTKFKPFKVNTMTLGYPKSGDLDRIIKYKHEGIQIGIGTPDWGAEPNKMYFIIKHGESVCSIDGEHEYVRPIINADNRRCNKCGKWEINNINK